MKGKFTVLFTSICLTRVPLCVCQFASVSHSIQKKTSTLRSQTAHAGVKQTYPPTIMASCGKISRICTVSSSLEAAVDSWVTQLGGFPEKTHLPNWVGCWFVGGYLSENICVFLSNLMKYLVLFVEIDFCIHKFLNLNGASRSQSCL